ncbi:MAG TPA: sigma-54 dependent transcriptional regulator [Polyangia bacterium]|jgi:DNA-binding NtrC family response regulator|nr:sigma-54 dependent transcriptional regulator [Polyangia bacterium]
MPSTVLIVDDEKNIRRTVRMVLEGEGFNVEEAGSGEEALARLPDVGADVMLLDVQLPGMSGLETIERVAKLKSPDPLPTVIMISGHATLADAVRAVKAGAYDLIEKPLDRERLIVALRNALERRAMAREVAGLRALADERFEMVGRSAVMIALHGQIAKVAPTRTRVLITGESGTGKELIARAIHRESALRDRPFIKVNCAAIPPELIESELFGHERGAFTGATARKRGLFEMADGGTIFLDEIGDMIASAQAKVLRVLQSGEFTRVGGEQTLKVEVRVVAATNRDLPAAVASGGFREDLYFRLAVVPLRAPPLRDRGDDIPLLCATFVEAACRENGMKVKTIAGEAVAILAAYPWPGNVRELRNVIERLVILSEESIGVGDLPEEIVEESARRRRDQAQSGGVASLPRVDLPVEARALPLREFRDHMEREYIRMKLDENSWNISRTATLLGIERTNLHKKMRTLGLSRDENASGA